MGGIWAYAFFSFFLLPRTCIVGINDGKQGRRTYGHGGHVHNTTYIVALWLTCHGPVPPWDIRIHFSKGAALWWQGRQAWTGHCAMAQAMNTGASFEKRHVLGHLPSPCWKCCTVFCALVVTAKTCVLKVMTKKVFNYLHP